MDRGNTFLRLMRCFRCMIIEDDPNESISPRKSPIKQEMTPVPVYLEPPGTIEKEDTQSSGSDDDWVITD